MIKNIIINEQIYELELSGGRKGSTGECFRFQKDNLDLAVKLYFSKKEPECYPELCDLEYFIKCSQDSYPILLSHYPVFDLSKNYIGCAAPFLEESMGKTSDILYTLPREQVIEGFYKLKESIPKISGKNIGLCDWGIHNLIIGENKSLPFGFYMVDDSSYFLDKDVVDYNSFELNLLITDMIDFYFSKSGFRFMNDDEKAYFSSFNKMANPVSFLEKESEGYSCMSEFLSDYRDISKKRKFYS